jgi:hypothetical protein
MARRSKAKHRRICAGKASFSTEEEAERLARLYQQKPYQCPICQQWHNTSQRET